MRSSLQFLLNKMFRVLLEERLITPESILSSYGITNGFSNDISKDAKCIFMCPHFMLHFKI